VGVDVQLIVSDRHAMNLHLCPSKKALGDSAAVVGAEAIRAGIQGNGRATIVVATGASQFERRIQTVVATP
jgi:glucosamine-6-phosphate deaminase